MTYLPFFLHSSLGIQLILGTALNQKQTLAQGTSIPEDKEGTNTLHQRRKQPLGQVFRDRVLQVLSLQETGQKGASVSLWKIKRSPMDTLPLNGEKGTGAKEETHTIHPSQAGPTGAHLFLRVLFSTLPQCSYWVAAPARLLCQHVQVWACGCVKGKQEGENV